MPWVYTLAPPASVMSVETVWSGPSSHSVPVRATAQALTDGRFTVHGGGQWRPLLHVRDAARAIVSALEAPVETVDHQIFNIGAEEEN